MAWNEPDGGRNDQDPWRGGGNKQSPPDLDEVVRKLQDKFGGLFGGGGKGGSGKDGGVPFVAIALVVLMILVIWCFSGFYRVQEAEQALILRFGKFHKITTAGLRWRPPFVDSMEKVDIVEVKSLRHRAHMLTKDENIIDVEIVVQYQVLDPKKYFLEISQPETTLRLATESALRHVVGGTEMDALLTEGREAAAVSISERLQASLDTYQTGLGVNKVNFEDAHPPTQVKAAFDDVVKAKEDEERVKNEAETYANGVIPEARGFAQRQYEEAAAYKSEVIARAEGEAKRFESIRTEYKRAPEVTRRRLYIEALESVLTNTTKVMVDSEGSNNLLYLPFDKLMSMTQSGEAPTAPAILAPVPGQAQEKVRRGADRLRNGREGRSWEGR